MLTNEQKDEIAKQLNDMYSNCVGFQKSMGKMMMDIYDKVLRDIGHSVDYLRKYGGAPSCYVEKRTRLLEGAGKCHNRWVTCSVASDLLSLSVGAYLFAEKPDSTCGSSYSFGWFLDSDGGRHIRATSVESLLHMIGVSASYGSMRDFVYDHADTHPATIIAVRDRLAMDWEPECRRLVKKYMDAFADGLAESREVAEKREREYDEKLLNAFGLSSAGPKVKRYKYSVSIKKIEMKQERCAE